MKKILVVGGYGAVGRKISRYLTLQKGIETVIAGRNADQARRLAESLNASWRCCDIDDANTLEAAIDGIDIVINSFSGPFTGYPLKLPEHAIQRGVHYLDLSGSYEYSDRLLGLGKKAAERGVTLITALGANPGLLGLLFLMQRSRFDTLDTGEVYFAMTRGIANGVSAAGLKKLHFMMSVKPEVWRGAWLEQRKKSHQSKMPEPINKSVYFSPLLTRDMRCLPGLSGVRELSFWTGAEGLLEGIVFAVGLSFGMARTDRGAARFKRWLEIVGGKRHPEIVVQVIVTGKKSGSNMRRTVWCHADELFATAIVGAVASQQIAENIITLRGAFVPPEVVDLNDFVCRLQDAGIVLHEKTEHL